MTEVHHISTRLAKEKEGRAVVTDKERRIRLEVSMNHQITTALVSPQPPPKKENTILGQTIVGTFVPESF